MTTYWYTTDTLLIHYWYTTDTLLIHYWYTTDTLLIHYWYTSVTLLAPVLLQYWYSTAPSIETVLNHLPGNWHPELFFWHSFFVSALKANSVQFLDFCVLTNFFTLARGRAMPPSHSPSPHGRCAESCFASPRPGLALIIIIHQFVLRIINIILSGQHPNPIYDIV